MQFDLKKFLDNGRKPYEQAFDVDFSNADFPGYRVLQPAKVEFRAENVAAGIAVRLALDATVDAECARCLAPIQEHYSFTREYLVKPTELDDPDFELPMSSEGCLDIQELAFQELLFEVPRVLLCSPDCLGLCPICGKKKAAGCSCQPADEAAPADARLSILKQLLS